MAKKTGEGNKTGKSGQSTNKNIGSSGKKSYQPTTDRTTQPPKKK